MVDPHNLVRQRQRALAVRDHDQRAVAAKLGERVVDQPLAVDVDLAGRFVEDQEFRVPQKRAGQGDPLPLAAAQPLAVRADDRLVAVGKCTR